MDSIKYYGGAVLAYIGDAYLEVLVRKSLIKSGITDTGTLTKMAKNIVCAKKQSELADKLVSLLDENESDVYRLGRNYKVNSKPKHSSIVEYHRASGFEAVFGYLHLSDDNKRAEELFDTIFKDEVERVISEVKNG